MYRGWLLHHVCYLNFRCPTAHLKLSAEDLDIRWRVWVCIWRLVYISSAEVFGLRYPVSSNLVLKLMSLQWSHLLMKFRSWFHFPLISKEDFITVFKIYFTTLENILKNLHCRFMQFVTNSTAKVFFRIKQKITTKKILQENGKLHGSCT